MLELLLDMMHGDLVLHDPCCRHVGEALVTEHEMVLHLLATSGALPEGLERAIEMYGMRHAVFNAPVLVRSSSAVATALKAVAHQLKEEGDPALASAGAFLSKTIAALHKRLETKRSAELIVALDEVILAYMVVAAEQSAAEQARGLEPGAPISIPSPGVQSLNDSIERFARSIVAHRAAKKRSREEATNQLADRLLFPPAAEAAPASATNEADPAQETSEPPTRGASGRHSSADPTDAPPMRVPRLVRQVSPDRGASLLLPQDQMVSAGPAEVSSVVVVESSDSREGPLPLFPPPPPPLPSAPRGAVLVGASEASVLMMMMQDDHSGTAEPPANGDVAKSEAAVTAEAVEEEVASRTDAVSPSPHAAVTAPGSGATSSPAMVSGKMTPSAGLIACLRRTEVVPRSYFPCAATKRFEPLVAKGFFV